MEKIKSYLTDFQKLTQSKLEIDTIVTNKDNLYHLQLYSPSKVFVKSIYDFLHEYYEPHIALCLYTLFVDIRDVFVKFHHQPNVNGSYIFHAVIVSENNPLIKECIHIILDVSNIVSYNENIWYLSKNNVEYIVIPLIYMYDIFSIIRFKHCLERKKLNY